MVRIGPSGHLGKGANGMSDVALGPGWWLASDGRWYPPPAPGPEPQLPAPEPDLLGVPMGDGGGSPRRLWVAAAVAAAVLLAVLGVVVAVGGGKPTGLPTGPGTATVTVVVPRTGAPSFTGSIAGQPLAGRVSAGVSRSLQQSGEDAFTYSGNLGGMPYVLHVSLDLVVRHAPRNGSLLAPPEFTVRGTYGTDPVAAHASFAITGLGSRSLTVPFSGTVGDRRLTGTATASPAGPRGRDVAITATFTVT